jgi:hypothetical protein
VNRRLVAPALAAALSLSLATGCEILSQWVDSDAIVTESTVAPLVDLVSRRAELVKYPSLRNLGLYSCGKLLGSIPCALIGPAPSRESLEFRFRTVFHIDNPNRYAVPSTELLVALSLWPGQTVGDLGAVCTTLCEPGAAGCPIPVGGACVDQAGDVRDLETFLEAALRGLITLAWEAATGQPVGGQLEYWTVAPADTVDLTFTFAIGIDPMVKLIETAAQDVLMEVLQSGTGELTIPYAFAGKVWFQVPYLGRIAVGVGPYGQPPEPPLTWKVL